MWIKNLLLAGCVVFFTGTWAESPSSFAKAKQIATVLFQEHPVTLYCHCPYAAKEIDLEQCGMSAALDKKRAHRLEWEHVMAAEHFGQHFECWRAPLCVTKAGKPYKGRACCARMDERFRHMEAELYNLWPEVGLVNAARSNYRFGMVLPKTPYYGCTFAIDKASRTVEPSDAVKGIVARAYLFMSAHYQLKLSDSQHKLFKAWNKQFPPDLWEQQWAASIASIEGYENPFISNWPESTGIKS